MPYNEKNKNYSLQYKKDHIKRIPFDVQIETYEQIKEHIQKTGESVNGFIKRAINETMEKDNNTIS